MNMINFRSSVLSGSGIIMKFVTAQCRRVSRCTSLSGLVSGEEMFLFFSLSLFLLDSSHSSHFILQ